MDADGNYASRQCSIPPSGIHLERLKRLNRLSYETVSQRPAPDRLRQMLIDASEVKERPDWQILLAQIAALSCLCLIFGGGLREIIAVSLVAALLHYVMIFSSKLGLDRIVMNAVNMWIATVAAIALMHSGLSTNGPVILITISMLVIPGIPLVNAVWNLLCGNEMNGILQVAKVVIETMAMGMGICLALWMCGMADGMSEAIVTTMSNPWLLIPISFAASFCFGIVFRIANHDLWLAGLGGALTRIALLVLAPIFSQRLAYVTFSALVAGLYAEYLATRRKDPSTYFIYPAIIPLIPGDLFYYSLFAMYLGDWKMFAGNATNCLLTLVGMSIGFVLSSIIAHYIRRMRHAKLIKAHK